MKTKAMAAIGALAVAAATGMMWVLAQAQTGREDCIPYKADGLRLTDLGARGWQLSREDGAVFMLLDTKEDAETMMAVSRVHTELCYVGRDNKRANRNRYVFHYWR